MVHARKYSSQCLAARLLVINLLDLQSLFGELIDVRHDQVLLHVHQHKARGHTSHRAHCRVVGTSRGAGVDEELVVVFKGLEVVRVASDQHIAVQTTLNHGQRFFVTPGHYLMTVCDTELERANRDNFLVGICSVLIIINTRVRVG